jgi:GNAT superfamily N-acetyltransferase
MTVSIRRAVNDDCSALLKLIHEHAEFERGYATITATGLEKILKMRRPPIRIFVATISEELMAYAALTTDYSLWRGRRWAHLDCLYITATARSLGIGAKLLRHVVDESRRLKLDRLEWQTPDWNHRAIAFYVREGAQAATKMRFGIDTRGWFQRQVN